MNNLPTMPSGMNIASLASLAPEIAMSLIEYKKRSEEIEAEYHRSIAEIRSNETIELTKLENERQNSTQHYTVEMEKLKGNATALEMVRDIHDETLRAELIREFLKQ